MLFISIGDIFPADCSKKEAFDEIPLNHAWVSLQADNNL
jgi:hypothetical protein